MEAWITATIVYSSWDIIIPAIEGITILVPKERIMEGNQRSTNEPNSIALIQKLTTANLSLSWPNKTTTQSFWITMMVAPLVILKRAAKHIITTKKSNSNQLLEQIMLWQTIVTSRVYLLSNDDILKLKEEGQQDRGNCNYCGLSHTDGGGNSKARWKVNPSTKIRSWYKCGYHSNNTMYCRKHERICEEKDIKITANRTWIMPGRIWSINNELVKSQRLEQQEIRNWSRKSSMEVFDQSKREPVVLDLWSVILV